MISFSPPSWTTSSLQKLKRASITLHFPMCVLLGFDVTFPAPLCLLKKKKVTISRTTFGCRILPIYGPFFTHQEAFYRWGFLGRGCCVWGGGAGGNSSPLPGFSPPQIRVLQSKKCGFLVGGALRASLALLRHLLAKWRYFLSLSIQGWISAKFSWKLV